MPQKSQLKSVSAGPKTATGKKVASMNATKHGVTAKNRLNKNEQNQYQSLLEGLVQEYEPKTTTEHILVERIANIKIRMDRFQVVEAGLFEAARDKASDVENILDSFDANEETRPEFEKVHARLSDLKLSNALIAEIASIPSSRAGHYPLANSQEELSIYSYLK